MPVKNLSNLITCPMCHTSKKWGEMSKHVAYSGESVHEYWREVHGFPRMIAFGHLKEYEPAFRIAVVREFPQ